MALPLTVVVYHALLTTAREGAAMDDARDEWAEVQAALAGDDHCFARIVTRHQARIARQMWRFTRDPMLLEELVQETFVQAYQSLARYRGEAPLEHWLARIATRVGYRHWQHLARERSRREAVARLAPAAPPLVDEASANEAAEYLHALLACLKPTDRLVLTLHYLEECDTAAIASRTGWSRTAVKVRLFRARNRLRALHDASDTEKGTGP